MPVADLLDRDDGTGGAGHRARRQYRLTTVNPFIRLRRDLIEQTHTPLVYADTDARETVYLRTTVLDQFRGDEWRPSAARPAQREHAPTACSPARPGSRRASAARSPTGSFELAPDFATTWLPLPYPMRELDVDGQLALRRAHPRRRATSAARPPPGLEYAARPSRPG